MATWDDYERKLIDTLKLSSENVDFLHHYTSQSAFQSMIEKKEIWFSHASYMNDPLEVDFGIQTIVGILKGNAKHNRIVDWIEKEFSFQKAQSLDEWRDMAFVLSLSEHDDHLNQWIRYANNGTGVSIKFSRSSLIKDLEDRVKSKNIVLFPVQYYDHRHHGYGENSYIFEKIVLEYFGMLAEALERNEITESFALHDPLYATTKLLGSFIKHEFHREESEWRLVLFSGISNDLLKVIPTETGLKIFFRIEYPESGLKTILEEIMVGPAHYNDTRVASALEVSILNHLKFRIRPTQSRGMIRTAKT